MKAIFREILNKKVSLKATHQERLSDQFLNNRAVIVPPDNT